MKEKMQVKDLINVGIFTCIYFVVFFATGMLGFIPLLFLAVPFLCPIVGGIPMMLYVTKIKNFGMMSLTGIICGILFFLTGNNIYPIVTAIGFGVLYDFILYATKYKSQKATIIGYGIFSLWIMGMMLPLYIATESYREMLLAGYGEEYANAIQMMTPMWTLPLFGVMAFIGGLIGGGIGKAVLKKHFKRAGLA